MIKLIDILNESDPKKGTGKKPKGSGRRLYTDENPSDTVSIKFRTAQDIKDTLSKESFKSKKHARQSQIINLIHQRVRAAYAKAKDPKVKARLKRALDYIEKRKEASKEKTERLNKLKEQVKNQLETFLSSQNYRNLTQENIDEGDTYEKMAAKGKKSGNLKQGTVRARLNIPKDKKVPMGKINKELSRLKKMDQDEDKKGVQLGDKNQKYYKALQLSKTLKSTTNLNEDNFEVKETSDPQSGKSSPYGSGYKPVKELVTDTEIICDNCGWKWKIIDGGDDLYICHKCYNDNTPEQLNEKCWPGYVRKGTKTMFGKKYPNCVKK